MEVLVDLDVSQWARVRARASNQDLTKPLRESMAYVDSRTKLRFLREVDPDGKPWAPLAPSTLKRKKGTILRETGRLINSLTWTVAADSAVYFTNVFYSIYLHFGTRFMPARPILGLSQKDIETIKSFFLRDIGL
ncbi:phage virion morphogenesis protein [Moorena sp. SIO3A2]|uniref:phage virion morphogenesis protein n=1 Tax=Moorena sp. SIO3A2 TaxID=2607841 RepID=UPI0013BDBD8D|nr:phage virion morphogenesis protein [Moorena sp. SIO3A2]NER90353.1 hypothetical protein [Moorena sp. SIO3A2]